MVGGVVRLGLGFTEIEEAKDAVVDRPGNVNDNAVDHLDPANWLAVYNSDSFSSRTHLDEACRSPRTGLASTAACVVPFFPGRGDGAGSGALRHGAHSCSVKRCGVYLRGRPKVLGSGTSLQQISKIAMPPPTIL